MKEADKVVDLRHLIPQLRDPYRELLLLWSCMDITKLFFGLRMRQLIHMKEINIWFDKELWW